MVGGAWAGIESGAVVVAGGCGEAEAVCAYPDGVKGVDVGLGVGLGEGVFTGARTGAGTDEDVAMGFSLGPGASDGANAAAGCRL